MVKLSGSCFSNRCPRWRRIRGSVAVVGFVILVGLLDGATTPSSCSVRPPPGGSGVLSLPRVALPTLLFIVCGGSTPLLVFDDLPAPVVEDASSDAPRRRRVDVDVLLDSCASFFRGVVLLVARRGVQEMTLHGK